MQVDVDPEEIGRNYPAQRLVGDARATLEALLDEGRRLGLGARRKAAAIWRTIESARAAHQPELAPAVTPVPGTASTARGYYLCRRRSIGAARGGGFFAQWLREAAAERA